MNGIDTRSQEERRLEGPLAGEEPRHVTAAELRALLIDLLQQLLTSPNLKSTLDELFCEMDYEQRPWQSFKASPRLQERVARELAGEIAALGKSGRR